MNAEAGHTKITLRGREAFNLLEDLLRIERRLNTIEEPFSLTHMPTAYLLKALEEELR